MSIKKFSPKKLSLFFIFLIGSNNVFSLDIKSNSYLLVDIHSDKVIEQKQSDLQLPLASITKIMTAYIVFSQIKDRKINIDDTVLISKTAAAKRGSRMFIRADSNISVNDLLHGMIISSGNDAAIALAEYISGSEELFAELMNETALGLRMNKSHFTNATGWPDPDHYSTASDIAILTKALIIKFPILYKIFSKKHFTYGRANNGKVITQKNRNTLLWANGLRVDGVKTGHTEAAGYSLVASVTQDDMRLVSVVMKTSSKKARSNESRKLLDYGIRKFRTKKIFSKNQVIMTAPIWKGAMEKIKIGVTKNVFLTTAKNKIAKIETTVKMSERIIAPIKANTKVGEIYFFVGSKLILTEPLIALEPIKSGGFFNNLLDSIILFAS